MTSLNRSPYSYHFLALRFLGSWLYHTEWNKNEGPLRLNLYLLYRLTISCMEVYGLMALLMDFYLVVGDMKKMTWNLCGTALLIGMMFKNTMMLYKREEVSSLRLKLHQDAESRSTPEHISINEMALKEMKMLRVAFYGAAILFIPAWMTARYIIRELPVPVAVPSFIDLEDDLIYNVLFFSLTFSAIFGMMIIMESELAMFGFLIQISREYRILLKDINKMSLPYFIEKEDDDCLSSLDNTQILELNLWRKEVNPLLKMMETKMLVKKFSERQATLIQYTQVFEVIFNKPLLQQFFGMSILIIVLALQMLWESFDFSGNLLYQMGYLYITVMDMFMLCWYASKLRNQCLDVGQTFYSTLWYRMGAEVRRDIAMMIMRSQRPPKITTGKFMELNLQAFMSTMSHVYSWLALFRQFDQTT